MRVSLPYYKVDYRAGRRRGTIYLEAYLSQTVEDRLICLLASKKPLGLDKKSWGVEARPWSSPDDVLRRYLEGARRLLGTPVALPEPRSRWALKRAIQEINRLFFGGFVVGPPAAPELDRGILSRRLASRLCKDLLGPLLSGGYSVTSSSILWKNVEVLRSESGLRVLSGGSEDRILSYVVGESRDAFNLLKKLALDL